MYNCVSVDYSAQLGYRALKNIVYARLVGTARMKVISIGRYFHDSWENCVGITSIRSGTFQRKCRAQFV